MSSWRFLDSGAASPALNMAIDRAILALHANGQAPPTLRFYQWQPAAVSLGYFQKTVLAGAELRERLSLGEKREDILAGLHRAIVLRAMSLLARSGGVRDEFTFTGGVAKNPAAVEALRQLLVEHYGALTVNISEDSIYTGALGAALFALREAKRAAA